MSSGRPAGLPAMSGARPANAISFHDDFFNPAIGPAPAIYGGFNWQQTTLGTAGSGSVGGAQSSTAAPFGTLQVTTGASANDGMLIEWPGRTTVLAQGVPASTTSTWNGQWRYAHTLDATGRIYGMGWVNQTLAVGTDWLTDPDTTLTGTQAIVIHCNTSAYSGDGADDVVLRVYDGVSNQSVVLSSAVVNGTYYKIEIGYSSKVVTAYFDGVANATTITFAGSPNTLLRPTFGILVTVATARTLNMDSYYQEVGLTTAR